MTSTTANGWWGRARERFVRQAEQSDHFAPDGIDRHSAALQSALPLFLAGLLLFNVNLFLDGDTGWHLGAGHWIVEHRAVPTVDPFSHTFAETPWTAHEWLAEVLMVGAEGVRGWGGLAVLFGLAGAATFAIISREGFRFLPARWAVALVLVIGGMLFTFSLGRPHMLAWPLLAFWTLLLLRARERNGAPPLVAALLMTVWANLHASYIVALGLAGLFALESLVANRRDLKLLGRWALFGLLSVGAAIVTPFGPSHFLYPFEVSGMKALAIIGEWRRSTPLTDPLLYLCLAGLLLLLRRRWREVPPLRLLLLLGLTALAISHARHQMLFAIIGSLVILPILNPAGLERSPQPFSRWFFPAAVLLVAVRLAWPYSFTETSTYPLTLLQRVPADLKARPMYNEYSQGGPLVMLGLKPYIDGRADMYGDDFTFRAKAITNGDIAKFREDAERFRIAWVLLEFDDRLKLKLEREPGWRKLVEDEKATVFVRAR